MTRAVTLAVLLAMSAVPVAAQRADLEKVIRRTVLANGLEVVAVENQGVPLVTLELVVRNGAFTQTRYEFGAEPGGEKSRTAEAGQGNDNYGGPPAQSIGQNRPVNCL